MSLFRIKLKNGKVVYVGESSSSYEVQCDWCSKTIKKDKKRFLQDGNRDGTCSLAHAKAYMNARA